MGSAAIRLLVVDEHTMVRKGLCALLSAGRTGIRVVGEAADGESAVSVARDVRPDVILMDLNLPTMSAIEAIMAIRAEDREARILVLSGRVDEIKVATAIRAGALGFLNKHASPEELIQAIHSVRLGQLALPGSLARSLLDSNRATAGDIASPLTQRELQILAGVAKGQSNLQIAEANAISMFTVRSHMRSIMRKLSLANRTQAAMFAVKAGLVQAQDAAIA